jgi:hypothetical protein
MREWKFVSFISIVFGLILGYITFNFNPLFQLALPVLALVIGYFISPRKMGSITSFLLFYSYILPSNPDVFSDLFGIGTLGIVVWIYLLFWSGVYGFIGYGGSIIREKGPKNLISSIAVLLVLLNVLFLLNTALPEGNYYAGFSLESPQREFKDLEIYLPAPQVNGVSYEEIFNNPIVRQDELKFRSIEIVESDFQKSVKIRVQGFPESGRGILSYHEKKDFPLVLPPYNQCMKFKQKINVSQTIKTISTKGRWEEKATFKTPVMVKSSEPVSLQIHWGLLCKDSWRIFPLENRENIYEENLNFHVENTNKWIFVDGVISIKSR